MGSVFSQAWDKREERRGRRGTEAGLALHKDNGLMQELEKAALLTLGQQASKTESTYVLAYLKSRDAILAYGIPKTKRDALATILGLPGKDYIKFVATGSATNLHGEMAIIRWLRSNSVVSDKSQLGGDLTVVCAGKPVCADCCGFMTKYKIVHGRVCGAGSEQGWSHPFSGAIFRGENQDDFTYQKAGSYLGSATMHNPNPRRL